MLIFDRTGGVEDRRGLWFHANSKLGVCKFKIKFMQIQNFMVEGTVMAWRSMGEKAKFLEK